MLRSNNIAPIQNHAPMCIKKYDRIPAESGIAHVIPMAIAYRSDRASVIKTICRGVVGRAKLLLYSVLALTTGTHLSPVSSSHVFFFSPSINIALTATKSCRRRPIRQHKRVTTHRRSIIILLLFLLLSSSYFTLWCCILLLLLCVRRDIYLFSDIIFRYLAGTYL